MYLTGERKWGQKLEETETEKIAQIWKKKKKQVTNPRSLMRESMLTYVDKESRAREEEKVILGPQGEKG